MLGFLGGIGLFLFGMQTMTGALRRLASRGMRKALASFTRTPLAGAATGAAVTALVQSSSATIMTAIGFVGAGLLSFPQALGVVLGANVGTTATGWMVAILGIKLELGQLALPLLFVGSLAALLGHEKIARTGEAAAGFALVFLGLDMMAGASATMEPFLTRYLASADGLGGRLALVLSGFVFTAVVQSSSAGVATVLVLLGGGTITLMQGAALIIGMDIGTTVKSVLGTIGGARDMRRTALAHVVYNVVTGSVAFLVLPLVPLLAERTGQDDPTALVIFHTMFNVAGVVLILPFAGVFARTIEHLVPGHGGRLPEPLDRALLVEPEAALDAAQASATQIASALFGMLADLLHGKDPPAEEDPLTAVEGLEAFLIEIPVQAGETASRDRAAALLHLVDHLQRLLHRMGQRERMAAISRDASLGRPARALAATLDRARRTPVDRALANRLQRLLGLIRGRTQRLRRSVLLREHVGLVSEKDVFALTDALRWLERTTAHAERIAHYASVAAPDSADRQDGSRPT